MGFSGSSRSPSQLESVSLRTNEEFVRLYNDLEEATRLCFQTSRVLEDDVQVICGFSFLIQAGRKSLDSAWQFIQENIWHVDHLMKRAEKCAQFSEVLGGIMLQFEQNIFPRLKHFRSCFENRNFMYTWSFMLDPILLLNSFLEVFAESVSSGLESAHKVVVSALALLSFVYQYLIGCVDKGGSKTYSPGLFRLIFVAIVLFLGSYVWIKFRQASFTANRRKRKSCQLADRASQLRDDSDVPAGVYRRAVKDPWGSVTHYKYEPRFKPRREKLESVTSLEFNYLPLGSYDTPRQAEIVRHIAAVLYGKEEVRPVQFEDGLCLPFPSVAEPEKCPSSGKEKAVWVTHKTKQLYAELLKEKARRLQLLHPGLETGSPHVHDGEAHRRDPSPSAPGAHITAIESICFTPPHGDNGVVEQSTTSESHSLGQGPLIAPGVFSDYYSVFDLDQVMSQWEENDFPAMNDLDKAIGDYSETDCVFDFDSTLVPPQSSALDTPTSAIFSSLPQLGGGDQGLGVIEPQLNSATAIPFQQLESLPEQVQLQLRATCEEQRPEEFSGSNVELQQKLLESEVRISELQQKLHQSEVENEKWRSMFRQLAKLI